ncbi:MAG: hypothetical protein WCQ49_01745 [Candidatus Saccharibacteria bacterium]
MDTDDNSNDSTSDSTPIIDSSDQVATVTTSEEAEVSAPMAPAPQMEAAPNISELSSQAEQLTQPTQPDAIPYTNTSSVQEPIPQTPAQPIMQTPAPSQPMMQAPIASTKKSFPAKLLVIIGSALLVLGGVGVALWIFVFSGMPLTKFSNNDYSVMVPASYVKTESGEEALFLKPGTTVDSNGSRIRIIVNPMTDSGDETLSKEYIITSVNDMLESEVKRSNSADKSTDNPKEEMTSTKSVKNGVNIWIATKNYIPIDKIVGKQIQAIYLKDFKMVGVEITILSADTDLAAAKTKILDSVVLK